MKLTIELEEPYAEELELRAVQQRQNRQGVRRSKREGGRGSRNVVRRKDCPVQGTREAAACSAPIRSNADDDRHHRNELGANRCARMPPGTLGATQSARVNGLRRIKAELKLEVLP